MRNLYTNNADLYIHLDLHKDYIIVRCNVHFEILLCFFFKFAELRCILQLVRHRLLQ